MTKADIMKALETKKVGSVMIEFKDDLALPGRSQLYEWKKKAEAIRKKRWRDNRNNPEKSGKNPEKSENELFWISMFLVDPSLRSVWKRWTDKLGHWEIIMKYCRAHIPIEKSILHKPPKAPLDRDQYLKENKGQVTEALDGDQMNEIQDNPLYLKQKAKHNKAEAAE